MISNILNIYKIGKELGLNKKEINRLVFFKNHKYSLLLIILTIITFTFLALIIAFSYVQIDSNTYPIGTKYSTVKIKDFRLKRNKRV